MIYKFDEVEERLDEFMSTHQEMFILALAKADLKENRRIWGKYDKEFIVVSDNLEELKKYMTDKGLANFIQEDDRITKQYYYHSEIIRLFVDRGEYFDQNIVSFRDKLYYMDVGQLKYRDKLLLTSYIWWYISKYKMCFKLDNPRVMNVHNDEVVIYDTSTEKDEIIETIEIKDLYEREDIIDEIIRNNFEEVIDVYR